MTYSRYGSLQLLILLKTLEKILPESCSQPASYSDYYTLSAAEARFLLGRAKTSFPLTPLRNLGTLSTEAKDWTLNFFGRRPSSFACLM